jgi:hypothetical protein
MVVSISFEGIDCGDFASPDAFCKMFLRLMDRETMRIYGESLWVNPEVVSFATLNEHLSNVCSNQSKKVVLLIDEVDKTSNNQVFLHFLGMLRTKFLSREKFDTFHSVILAGVNDIKNIKQKMITSGTHTQSDGEGIYNSPWNIAANFDVDMSFNPAEIETMLVEYESEHATKMNTTEIAEEIYAYTGGYPFLVSRLCKIIDEKLNKDWTVDAVRDSVQLLLKEDNTLFDDLFKNLKNNSELSDFVKRILIQGEEYDFDIYDPVISLGVMYGFFKEHNAKVAISNRIFEIRIADFLILQEKRKRTYTTGTLKEDVVENGRFNMETCLRKFAQHYYETYNDKDSAFLERDGRLLFLFFVKPLINGAGFYYMEAETRNSRRLDIVINYNNEEFIIELKIWHGEKYKEKAHAQLLDYMSAKGLKTGYLLTFDFRKDANKETGAQWIDFDDGCRIFDVTV